ncbi:MAG: acyl-CoA thioesterase [Nitrospirae bacterium]|nr:acyl-CoA thioesterase [Nitrospirota bacterium]
MIRYHLRLLWIYLKYRFRPTRQPASITTWRVKIRDCDLNRHMNNAVYLLYFDAGRMDLILRSGAAARLVRERCRPMLGGVDVTYRRELRPGTRFQLQTRFDGLNGKVVHVRQDVFVGETLHTSALARLLILKNGRVTDPSFLADLVVPTPSDQLPTPPVTPPPKAHAAR